MDSNDRRIDAEFDIFRQDLADSARPEPGLADMLRAAPKLTSAADMLAAHRADIAATARRPRDPFEVESAVHRQRIAREIATPVKPGQVFTPSGAPLGSVKAAGADPLMIALEQEASDDDPQEEMLRAMGIAPSAPGAGSTANLTLIGRGDRAPAPGLAPLQPAVERKRAAEARRLLDPATGDVDRSLSMGQILDAVRLRMGTGQAADFCGKLADMAFEQEQEGM
jgi:hypothetical protein